MTNKPTEPSGSNSVAIDPRMLNHYYDQDDEIDLFQLFANLWAQKKIILLITFLIMMVGVGYAFFATPIYESKVYLMPPTEKGVAKLKEITELIVSDKIRGIDIDINIKKKDYSDYSDYSVLYVYKMFIQTLTSKRAKHLFFQRQEIKRYYMDNVGSETKAQQNLINDLSINIPKKDKLNIDISFRTNSAQYSAEWLNSYVDHVISLTKEQLISDILENIESKKMQIQLEMESLTKVYHANLKRELDKLNEALFIARSLGLSSPMNMHLASGEKNNLMIDEVRRLYRLGTNVLETEIKALKNRKNTESFVSGMSELLLQQELLAVISIKKDEIVPAQIDLSAQVTKTPIKPKKVLIISISLVLGVMVGVFSALIRSAMSNRKEQNVELSDHTDLVQ